MSTIISYSVEIIYILLKDPFLQHFFFSYGGCIMNSKSWPKERIITYIFIILNYMNS